MMVIVCPTFIFPVLFMHLYLYQNRDVHVSDQYLYMSSCAVPVVLPSIPQVLSDQEEVWLEGSPAGPPGSVQLKCYISASQQLVVKSHL